MLLMIRCKDFVFHYFFMGMPLYKDIPIHWRSRFWLFQKLILRFKFILFDRLCPGLQRVYASFVDSEKTGNVFLAFPHFQQ